MNGESELPEGWVEISLKNITTTQSAICYGVLKPGEFTIGGVPLIRVKDIKNSKIEINDIFYISPEIDSQFYRSRLKGGEILISVQGSIGRIALVPEVLKGANISRTIAVVPLKEQLLSKWIYFILQSPQVQQELSSLTGGTTRDSLNIRDLREVTIPLPPLAEQRRIVAAVETLLARVNASRERLDRVPGLLKAFRQAVLAAACSGRLTEGWREENKNNSRLTSSPVIQDLYIKKIENERNYIEADIEYPILPISWKWYPIGEFIKFIGSGITPRGGKNAYQRKDGVPFIRSQNVYPDGLRFDDIAFISEELHNTMLRTHTKPDDVLLNITGASIGRSTFIPPEIPIANVNQHVCIIRTDGTVFPKYLSIFLNSQIGQDQIYKLQGGQTREGLNYHQVKSIKVSIPPIPEQHEIVRRVESLFTVTDRIEQQFAIGKDRADRLTQAILAKAFRGELVPTEAELARSEGREYEPASVLLERIRRERGARVERKPQKRQKRAALDEQ